MVPSALFSRAVSESSSLPPLTVQSRVLECRPQQGHRSWWLQERCVVLAVEEVRSPLSEVLGP